MILTCPSCTMRYLVAEGAVGPDGRRIKCAHCGHQWFQEGEEGLDESLFDSNETAAPAGFGVPKSLPDDAIGFEEHPVEESTDEPFDFQSILQKQMDGQEQQRQEKANPKPKPAIPDIPHGVRPAPEEQQDIVIPVKTRKAIKLPAMDARVGGFATAALIFISILGVLLLMQPKISRAWPPSNMLYGLIGLKPALPGEGLALANLQAKYEDDKVILSGDINNLKTEDLNVPPILASFVGPDDAVLGQVLIPPPMDRIKGEGHASFSTLHSSLPEAATNVTFAFSYMKAERSEIKPETTPEADSHAKEAEEGHEDDQTLPETH